MIVDVYGIYGKKVTGKAVQVLFYMPIELTIMRSLPVKQLSGLASPATHGCLFFESLDRRYYQESVSLEMCKPGGSDRELHIQDETFQC